MRVLVVEDDPEISRFIVRGLAEERHLVDLVEDGVSAVEMAAAEEYDAVMLDLMLPGLDGFEVCRRLRARGVDTPVIIVTARDAVADRVTGLDGGADDFLVKPFAFDELLARLRAVGRRGRTRHLRHALE
jgi:DNA-binding response OmpR family regulator